MPYGAVCINSAMIANVRKGQETEWDLMKKDTQPHCCVSIVGNFRPWKNKFKEQSSKEGNKFNFQSDRYLRHLLPMHKQLNVVWGLGLRVSSSEGI